MKDQFVTYEIAKRLKELGFNEECIAGYYGFAPPQTEPMFFMYNSSRWQAGQEIYTAQICSAPLWQQAIDWLREKHRFHVTLHQNGVWKESQNDEWYAIVHDAKVGRLNELDTPMFVHVNNEKTAGTFDESREAAITRALELIK